MKSVDREIKVRIYRYNPLKDKESRYETYKVPYTPYLSILNILEYLYENIDSTLAFPSHAICMRGVCGNCTVLVNGRASLACQTIVPEDAEEITIEPLPRLKVVKDLVVKR